MITEQNIDRIDDFAEEVVASPPLVRRRTLIVAVAVTAVLTGVIALLGGVLLTQSRPGDASAEAGFARDMASHHAQAVEMAMLAYDRTSDPDVRTVSFDMALTQQGQIGIMQDWLWQWNVMPTGDQPRMAWMGHGNVPADGRMPGMASQADLDRLRGLTGRDLDVWFCQLMIRHHLGGVMMADAILQRSDEKQVVEMAESIKAGQQAEIRLLTELLARNGAKPL